MLDFFTALRICNITLYGINAQISGYVEPPATTRDPRIYTTPEPTTEATPTLKMVSNGKDKGKAHILFLLLFYCAKIMNKLEMTV